MGWYTLAIPKIIHCSFLKNDKSLSGEWIPTKWLWCSFIERLVLTMTIVLEMVTEDVYICEVFVYFHLHVWVPVCTQMQKSICGGWKAIYILSWCGFCGFNSLYHTHVSCHSPLSHLSVLIYPFCWGSWQWSKQGTFRKPPRFVLGIQVYVMILPVAMRKMGGGLWKGLNIPFLVTFGWPFAGNTSCTQILPEFGW